MIPAKSNRGSTDSAMALNAQELMAATGSLNAFVNVSLTTPALRMAIRRAWKRASSPAICPPMKPPEPGSSAPRQP